MLNRQFAMLLATIATIVVGSIVHAAGLPSMPSDDEISDLQKKTQKMPDDAQMREVMKSKLEQAQKAFQQVKPSDMAAASKAFPKVDAAPGGADLEEIAKRFEKLGQPSDVKTQGNVFVFVSLTMPRPSLDRIVRDSERAGSVLVLRGLQRGSFRNTVSAIRDVMGNHKATFQIDPKKYERYGVSVVPTTVLIIGDQEPCVTGCQGPTPKYYSVEGDVSLEYALDEIVKMRPNAKTQAVPYLVRLRGDL